MSGVQSIMTDLSPLSALQQHPVAVFAPSAYPVGGVAVWIDHLHHALAAVGGRLVLVAPDGGQHDLRRYREMHPSVDVVSLLNATGSHEGRLRAIHAALASVKPGIVLGANIGHLYPALERYLPRASPRPRVAMTMHGLVGGIIADADRFAHVLDLVICTNRMTQALVPVVTRVAAGRTAYAPYGVDVVPANRVKSTGATLRLAWVGRFESEQKRVMDLPRVLEALEKSGVDFEVRIAGEGPEEARLKVALARWLVDGRVLWLGPLPPCDVFRLVYSQIDALLITSEWETGPIVAWEAMAHGVAVVCSDYVGHRLEGALVHEATCLMFPRGEAVEAARQLRTLLDAGLASRISRAGRDLVLQRYSSQTSGDAWIQVLASMLSQSRNRALQQRRWRPTPAGRLDRLLGVGLAETLRVRLGFRFAHDSPGAEWPHALSQGMPDEELVKKAEELELAAVAR